MDRPPESRIQTKAGGFFLQGKAGLTNSELFLNIKILNQNERAISI
jgi:hypothetical protein